MPITPHQFRERTQQPVDLSRLEEGFVPPPHFSYASFDSYVPDPEYPSQSEAVSTLKAYLRDIKLEHPNFFLRLLGKQPPKDLPHGLYLDGGFGVGKTHLLAAAYHSFHGKKAYLSFQELMFYVGLKRLDEAVVSLSHLGLLIIDEFELDDPANTRIASNLLNQLFAKGVHVLASSNTPPGALGEGKFSVADFERELGELTAHFTTLRVDGDDYRTSHSITGRASRWTWNEEKTMHPSPPDAQLSIEFEKLLAILSSAHPMRIRQSLEGVGSISVMNAHPIADAHHALRLVYFIDKIYDNDVRLSVRATAPLSDLFQRSYFHGGDTKKYLRALSRLQELTSSVTADPVL